MDASGEQRDLRSAHTAGPVQAGQRPVVQKPRPWAGFPHSSCFFLPLLRFLRPTRTCPPSTGPRGASGRLHRCSAALLLALPLIADQPLGSPLAMASWTSWPAAGQLALMRSFEPVPQSGAYQLTPARRALLNTIRYAEGTWIGGSHEGYRVLYGGGRFNDLSRHPEITVHRRYSSAAAGAYQFLPATWKEAAAKLNLDDFQPTSQDQAALYLVEKRGALRQFDREGLSPAVLARLASEWASLPTMAGASAYGQPVHQAEELRRFFSSELERELLRQQQASTASA